MPIELKQELAKEEINFGRLLLNRFWFIKYFWKDELTIPEGRDDLPVEWAGKQIISPEQRMMMLDQSDKILLCTGRKLMKSILLLGVLVQTGILYARDRAGESLLTTPGDHHLAPLRRRLEIKIDKEPFFDIMIKRFNKSKGFVEFATGMTWWMRVEGQKGRGESQVSLRADVFLGDEMAFGDQASHEARQQTVMPGSHQILAGVPGGVRNSPFYRLDQTSEGNSWSRHKYSSFINPLFQSDKVRKEREESHGGVNTQSYLNQVLGQWGKEAYSSFPKIPYITALPYKYIELTEEQVNVNLSNLVALLDLPVGGVKAQSWILGGDLGYSPAPSVFLVFYLREGVWYQLARVVLRRCNPFNQARIIDCINCQILPEPFTVIMLDAHIWGSSVVQCLLHDPFVNTHDDYGAKVIDANFAGRVEDPNIKIHRQCKARLRMIDRYWWCDKCGQRVWQENDITNANIPTKQHYTAKLKDALAYGDIYISGRVAD